MKKKKKLRKKKKEKDIRYHLTNKIPITSPLCDLRKE